MLSAFMFLTLSDLSPSADSVFNLQNEIRAIKRKSLPTTFLTKVKSGTGLYNFQHAGL